MRSPSALKGGASETEVETTLLHFLEGAGQWLSPPRNGANDARDSEPSTQGRI